MPFVRLSLIKKILQWVAITFGAVMIMGVLIGLFYSKEIKGLIISELNKNLSTEIKVEDFDFSVIRHFPFASFEMEKVLVYEAVEQPSKDTLLAAERLSLLFNFFEVFQKDVSIRKIIVKNGSITVRVDADGKDNYHFWKKGGGGDSSGMIDLNKIVLKDVRLMYDDKKDRQLYTMQADQAVLSGSFGADRFSLSCDAKVFVNRLWIHGVDYVTGKKVVLKSGIDVNNKDQIFRFPKSEVRIADVDFLVDGSIDNSKQNWMLDIDVKAKEAGLTSLITILPAPYLKYLGNFKTSGQFVFDASIKGSVNGKNIPDVKITFSVNKGKLSSPDAPASLEQIDLKGLYTNRSETGKSRLAIGPITASLDGHLIRGRMQIDDFDNAYLTAQASADLDLAEVRPFIKADTLESLTGKLALNVQYGGKISDIRGKDKYYHVDASGTVVMKDVGFRFRNNPLVFEHMNGTIELKDRDILIRDFKGNVSATDYLINGTFKNFITFLLIPGQEGELQADLKSRNVNLDELLANKSASDNDTSYIMKFNPRLICSMQVKADKLNFRRFHASSIGGQIDLRNQVISGRGLSFKAMDGTVRMNATINAARKDSVFMTYDTRFERIDITRMFYELENFDQQTLTDKNVKGRINADVQFTSAWSNTLVLNSRSVKSVCSVTIENGELNNFKPIQAIGRYIKVSDLDHIRFSNMTNTISIADRKINIPMMEINSTALNISGSGIHDFDNNIDYHIRLLMSDVLGKKVQRNDEFGEIEDDGLGRSKLFLAMKGTVNNPKFALDRKAAAEKVKTDVKNEKQNLKEMLRAEFGMFKRDTTVVNKPKKKKEEMQVEWD